MCLHVRALLGVLWFSHAGHEHEYTPPTFLILYGFLPEPCISYTCPFSRSMTASPLWCDGVN